MGKHETGETPGAQDLDTERLREISDSDLRMLEEGRHPDPFAVLGCHLIDGIPIIRAFLPGADKVRIVTLKKPCKRFKDMASNGRGLFEAVWSWRDRYRLEVTWGENVVETADPYSFGMLLRVEDLHHFSEGKLQALADCLGANVKTLHGETGVLFAVWAPNASSVSVVGDFNSWDARRHPMRCRYESGVWELFVPGVKPGDIYKYAIRSSSGMPLPWKADPLARRAELPPRTGSIVAEPLGFQWNDSDWLTKRASTSSAQAPISIYEVHVSGWLRTQWGQFGSWDEAVERLVPYVKFMGFTHVELMPIAEHPFGGSWGYQPLGLFAPTSRLGDPAAFCRFVDHCHSVGVGVLLDWVPGHFPSDEHGLMQFDGTALYEHLDPKEGFHTDWNTMIYNFGRREVKGFLIASALNWVDKFHVDGLRVDAVASMLYRDYSREAGQWVPNHLGGRENLEAISVLQELNTLIGQRPGFITIAEESTAWPGVTLPVERRGLGFHFKWNMGWMHDTLDHFARDPIYRSYHTHEITFGLEYGFSEKYILPISHDEVVHGKQSLLSKMPGDEWQRFANLRLFLSLMWMHPGKKLLFMGCEFGQDTEWNVDAPFPWPQADDRYRTGLSRMVRDLNFLLRATEALHQCDTSPGGFEWRVMNDTSNSVFAFIRKGESENARLLVVANMTPVPRADYRVGVPRAGRWREVFNSDSEIYGGSNLGNFGVCGSSPYPMHGDEQSLALHIPPLGLVALHIDPE